MPEDEAQDSAKKEESGGGGGFLGGAKGWIVVIAVVVIEAAFFLVVLKIQSASGIKSSEEEKKVTLQDIKVYNAHTVVIDELNYSIPMPTGTTATLAMSLTVNLGLTEDELTKGSDFTIADEDWNKFKEAVQRMEPLIRDRLMQYISQQTYAQLSSASGKEKIKVRVKQMINDELAQIKLDLIEPKLDPKRVTEVFLPTFYLQQ